MPLDNRQKRIAQLKDSGDLFLFKELENLEKKIEDTIESLPSGSAMEIADKIVSNVLKDIKVTTGPDEVAKVIKADPKFRDEVRGKDGDSIKGDDGADAVLPKDFASTVIKALEKKMPEAKKVDFDIVEKFINDKVADITLPEVVLPDFDKIIEDKIPEVPNTLLDLEDTPEEYSRGHILLSKEDRFEYFPISELTKQVIRGGGGNVEIFNDGTKVGSGSAINFIGADSISHDGHRAVVNLSGGSGGSGDVTAGSNLGNNLLIRGDGSTKGVQNTGITINDSDSISGIVNISLSGTVDGIDVATDVAANTAKLTANTTNVTNAGALMDSELTSIADVKALDQDVSNGSAPVFDASNMTSIPAGTVNVVSNVATNTILGRDTAGSGNSEELTPSAIRTLINVEDGSTGNQTGAEIKTAYEAEANAYTDTKNTKLSGIEASADVTDTGNVTSSGALMDSELSSIADVKALDQSVINGASPVFATTNMTDASNKRFVTDAQEAKIDYLTVTQAVNLDQMETDIAALANGMVYKGVWDASSGSFAGSGSAQTGWFYYVSVAGTVDSVSFAVGDNVIAVTDDASASTYASNWSKHDQTDAVQSVAGKVGAVTLVEADITDLGTYAPIANPTFTGEIGIGSINVSETELGILEGATLSTAELNYVDGVTSSIQTQLDAKYESGDSPTFATITTTGNIELGHASDTTIARVGAGVISVEGIRIKTTTPDILATASYTTNTGTSLNMNNLDNFVITAQAGALLFNAPGGTLVQGRSLVIRIKDNGTARALTWNSIFRAMGTALPSTTVVSKTLYLGFFYNSTDTKWDLVASAQEA